MPAPFDAIVLCGGSGTRLRSVTLDSPKSLAGIAGRPFLELLLRQLRRYGFDRVILAIGYRGDMIREHVGENASGLRVEYSEEASPLGTGGALRKAAEMVASESVLVLNGDSYTDADLGDFVARHLVSGAEASVLVVAGDGRSDCGTVDVDDTGRLRAFVEKQGAGAGYINAGIYVMSRHLLCDIPVGPASLEREVFPRWLAENRDIRAFVSPGPCVDIGTPERYWNAHQLLGNVEPAECPLSGKSEL